MPAGMNVEPEYEFLDGAANPNGQAGCKTARRASAAAHAATQVPAKPHVDLTHDDSSDAQQQQLGGEAQGAAGDALSQEEQQQEDEADSSSQEGGGEGDGTGLGNVRGSGRHRAAMRPSMPAWVMFAVAVLALIGAATLVLFKPVLLEGAAMQHRVTPISALLSDRQGVEQQLKEEVALLQARLQNATLAAQDKDCFSHVLPDEDPNTTTGTTAQAPATDNLQQLLAEQQQQLLQALAAHQAAGNGQHAYHCGAAAAATAAEPACWAADATTTRRYVALLQDLTHLGKLHRNNTRRAFAAAAAAVRARLAPAQPVADDRVVATGAAVATPSKRSGATRHDSLVGFTSEVRKAEDAAARVLGATMSMLPMRLAELHVLVSSIGASHALRAPIQSLEADVERAAAMLANSLGQCEEAVRSAHAVSLEARVFDVADAPFSSAHEAAAAIDAAAARGSALADLQKALIATRNSAATLELLTLDAAWTHGVPATGTADAAGGGRCYNGADGQEAEAVYRALVEQLMGQ